MPNLSAPTMNRRRVLASAAIALPWLASTRALAQDAPLKLCQSTALSGPLGDLGTALHLGAKAAFNGINAKGGIHGREILLQTLDDGYEVPRAVANLDTFLADKDCFALFNCMGTPMVEAMLPKVKESGIPFFAPFTGGGSSAVCPVRAMCSTSARATPRRPKNASSTFRRLAYSASPSRTRTTSSARKC